jgi:Uma2 family endonuclease
VSPLPAEAKSAINKVRKRALLLPFDTGDETLPRKKFTRAEVERLTADGYFEGQRYELIDGDLIDKMGQKPPHMVGIQLLFKVLVRIFGLDFIRGQGAIEASDGDRERSVPEPDVAVTAAPMTEYFNRHPRGEECVLVAEVSDATLRSDLTRKSALYARAAVPEYWVVDLKGRRLIVHRHPRNSIYNSVQFFSESECVSLEGRTEIIRVAELLPPTAPDTEQ